MPTPRTAITDQIGTGSHPIARLISLTGVDVVTPADVKQRIAAADFFWLDLESLDTTGLEQFARSLKLDALGISTVVDTARAWRPATGTPRSAQRPSVAALGGAIEALLPAASSAALDAAAIPVWVLYTGSFLLTVRSGACQPLEQARRRFAGLRDEGKTNGALVFFLVMDELADSFEPQLLALDARLDEIQVELLTNTRNNARAELLAIQRRLAAAVQALGWYTGDLDELIAAGLDQLPGMGHDAQAHFDRHRKRIIRMTDAAQDYREEAREALGQHAANIFTRQGQVINFLAVISAVFLPLTFLTGYFGMNFDVLTHDLKSVWVFIVLGNLLPFAAFMGVVLGFRRWLTHLGISTIVPARKPAGQPKGAQQTPAVDGSPDAT
jgi:magnesium transporter